MENIDIPVIRTITGQVRHRRKLLKTLFFIDIQPVDGSEKSQIFIRSDDNSQSEYAVQDAFKACRPGNVVKIQVGHALNPKEGAGRGYQVWQSNKPVQVMTPFALREPFLQDPPLASKLDGSKVEKSKINCKYWLNQQYCARGEQCKKGHPTGEAFERARADWLEERLKNRKVVTFNPDDPHVSKKPHALRAFIFADWIRKTFEKELKQGHGVLDIAGGKGEIAMFLSRGFGVPTTVIEPKERKLQSYWYARLRRLIYRFETGNMDRPDWESGKINIDLNKWPYDETPHYMHTMLDDQFLKDYPDIISNASVFIGLHSDQATEPIVDAAIKMGKAFAVVPCCVFSHENRERRLKNGQLVTTTEDFIQYLMEKDVCGRGNIEKAYLDFEGKNQVVYWKPQINN